MQYTFFYGSAIIIIALIYFTKALYINALHKIIIGIATIGYSLILDIIFGELIGLFHYISPQESMVYMILSAVFIYPMFNILYVAFLPDDKIKDMLYTVCWVVALLIFEYLTLITKTIVFTGWKILPWSVIAYITSYCWIYLFYQHLLKKYKSR